MCGEELSTCTSPACYTPGAGKAGTTQGRGGVQRSSQSTLVSCSGHLAPPRSVTCTFIHHLSPGPAGDCRLMGEAGWRFLLE